MKTIIINNRFLTGALLLLGFGLPQASWAASGCSNSYLSGTYNAQISNANLLNTMSTPVASLGSNATTLLTQGFFANNVNSLASETPAIGRFFFDGGGNIIGADPTGVVANVIVGSYNVNSDCTMTMQVNTGQTFSAVLAANGSQVLFLETDANGQGAIGTLTISPNLCGPSYVQSPQSFGFAYSGAESVVVAQTAGVTPASPSSQTYSAIGTLTLDGSGDFAMTQWTSTGGAIQQQLATGTYTIGGDCTLALSYNPDPTTGAPPAVPQLSLILASNGGGTLVATPPQGTSLPGQILNASKVQQ